MVPRSISPRLLAFPLVAALSLLSTRAVAEKDRRPKPVPPNLPRPVVTRDPKRRPLLKPDEFLPPSRLRRGMTGHGLTVFQGNRIERFEVTILGVVKKANNGRDLILVKLSGPTLRRVSDIIAGMSGSPVYVDGKIIGAVAYGASFTRESMGYVTPIEDMLEAWDPGLPQNADDDRALLPESPVADLPAPVTVEGKSYRQVRIARAESGVPKPGVLSLHPLNARVTVSGVSGPRFAQVAKDLAELGLEARQGGGVAASGLKGSPLTPGGAVAMSLATGDIDITGIGTLTYRRDDRIVAFGHPFLGIGPLQAPMFSAYIHDIEPSFNESHKVGSPVKLVGTFSQDRPYSISGRIGATPGMVPITVRVRDRMMGRSRTFHARLLKHPALLARLVTIASSAAVAELHSQPGEATAMVTTTVETEGFGTVRRTNRVQDGIAIETAVGEDLKNAIGFLTNNSYGRVGIRSVAMDVDIAPGKQAATIERIFLKQTRFEPGDTVEIGVVLKPYKKTPQIRTIRLRLPSTIPVGSHSVTVQGGATGFGQSGLFAAFMGRGIDFSNTTSVAQMIRRYHERDRNDALVARLVLPTASLLVKGEKLEGLPPNIEGTMRIAAGRSTGARLERDEIKVSEETPWVLAGIHTLPLRVVKKGSADSSSPAFGSGSANDAPGNSSVPVPNAGLPAPLMSDDATFPVRGKAVSDFNLGEIRSEEGISESVTAPPEPIPAVPAKEAAPPAFVGRQPGIWKQSGLTDFRTGYRDGVVLTSLGDLRLGAVLSPTTETAEPYFWCVVPDGADGVFAGTGDEGRIYHVSGNGTTSLYAVTGTSEVYSLVRLPDGTLVAGTAPDGKLFRIGTDGKSRLLSETNSRFVLSLCVAPTGKTLYAGAGGKKGAVFAVPLDGTGATTEIYKGDEGSITVLTTGRDGSLYAGTSPNGMVLKLTDGAGKALEHPEVVFDAAETTISGLTIAPNGVIYAATAPRAAIYRIPPGGSAKTLVDRPTGNPLNGLILTADGLLRTVSGNSVLTVDPETGMAQTLEAAKDVQFTGLCTDATGTLRISTASVGGIYSVRNAGSASGSYTSPVFDARTRVRWGTLRFLAESPAGSGITVRTRTGDTSEPDDSWTPWSAEIGKADGERISSASGRFLQYRADFTGSTAAPVVLRSVEVFYLAPNQTPQITLQSPRAGEFWRGEKAVRWNATDPDRDTLSYEVFLSSDGGRTWQIPARKGTAKNGTVKTTEGPVKAAPPVVSAAPAAPSPAILAELDKHPEISPEMRARILADAPKTTPPVTMEPSTPAGPTNRTSSLTIDTTKWDDGDYLIKVVATDQPSNPTDAQTAQVLSAPFRIANRPPALSLREKEAAVREDKSVTMEGVALHTAAPIRAVQFRVDGGEWQSAVAADGIFDSVLEPFTVVTAPLTGGNHTLEVQAIDEAGNSNTQKATVTVRR